MDGSCFGRAPAVSKDTGMLLICFQRLPHVSAVGFVVNIVVVFVYAELTQAEEALRVAEEAVAVSRIAALERRAKPVRRASRAVRARGTAGGLRQVFLKRK